jgi:integrase
LEKLDEDVDRRHERRPLTDAEATNLFKTTLKSKEVFRGLSGQDRAMLYMLAQRSGLRRRELLTLTPQCFNLNANPPTVRVAAINSKHRKEDILPLPVEVAKELATYLKDRDRAKPIWPGGWWRRSADMFRADLVAAEIEDTDADGKVLDFHGQRMTFISGLARAGVSPTKAQKLARHSDVNLTLRTYTHLSAEELASAVESLPSLTGGKTVQASVAAGEMSTNEPELQAVIQAWPKLSIDIRRAIAVLIAEPVTQ